YLRPFARERLQRALIGQGYADDGEATAKESLGEICIDAWRYVALRGVTACYNMFTKLFSKILDSSVWLEADTTRIVWFTLLAAMDEDGFAHFSSDENLAHRARVSLVNTKKALDCFLAPDKNSGNPAN